MRRVSALALGALAVAGAALFVFRPAAVETAAATRGSAVRAAYATGVVEPVVWGRVSPKTSGRIAEIIARDGDFVAKDGALARLDDRQARLEIEEWQAKVAYWRGEVERMTALASRGFASRESFDRARSEAGQASANLSQARERLSDLTLRAPLQGVVLRQDGEVGDVVDAKDVLFWVGNERPLRITAEVDEEDMPRVRAGLPALIKADAFPGEVLRGTVAAVTPKGDPLTKTFRVRIGLPDDSPLRVGMTVEVNLVVEERSGALLVPARAVQGERIWVVEDGRARLRDVRIGIRAPQSVEVLSGVSDGDRVILDPPPKLRDGERVTADRRGLLF